MEFVADDAAGAALYTAIGNQADLFRFAAPATGRAADHALLGRTTRCANIGIFDLDVWPAGIDPVAVDLALFLDQRLDMG